MSNGPTSDDVAEDGHQSPASGYEVGYGRPPKHTQWPKGVCGNPKKIRKRRPKPIATLIDEFFEETIEIVTGGNARRVTTLEAIFRQLVNQAIVGKKGAANALLLYQAFVSERCGRPNRQEYEFVVRPDQNDRKADHG
jgi:hypothetical protein